MLSIADFYKGTPNDDADLGQALYDAIYEAKQTGKECLWPAGPFNLNRKVDRCF